MTVQRSKVILVDDNKASLDQGRNLLKTFYEVYPALSAAKLFEILENIAPDLILLDIEMPEMNGYEALKLLKGDPRRAEIPVIFLTSKSDDESELAGFDLGASDYVRKPFSGPLLLKRIEKELLMVKHQKLSQECSEQKKRYADDLAAMAADMAKETVEQYDAILSTLLDMAEFRGHGHKGTRGHSSRVRLYMQALLEGMRRSGTYADEVQAWDDRAFLISAQMHDIGMVTVLDSILNKPGKLDSDEYDTVKTHVGAGTDAIEVMMGRVKGGELLDHAIRIAGTHHEKWDGSGYPIGLTGKNIPLEGRMMAVVDAYDALTSGRPHREAVPHEEARKVIEASSWTHFDPLLVDVFTIVEGDFSRIADSGE
jgi:putative two-component system response regulator